MPLGTEVDLGPRPIVLDENPTTPETGKKMSTCILGLCVYTTV